MTAFRIGHGYDIHRLCPGRRLVLGGETIEFELGLDGHSDADVVCHAVMDAILGAAAMGDIGTHFPDTDPSFKDADSIDLLKRVNSLVTAKGHRVGNIDITIIAEKPRLSPYISGMRRNISKTLGLVEGQVSVKATTNERLGFIGRGEGIATFAVALLYK
jgi:2-C-methyl-D-erythritol 2,4-cyclodiphosphate synthase